MDEAEVPDWLTNNFLQMCLQSDKENFDQIEVKGFSAESAVPPGNNYSSKMLRLRVCYDTPVKKDANISLIVKSPIMGLFENFSPEALNSYLIKESTFYNLYITETKKISKHDIVPKNYISSNPLCLVMEDLKDSGYKMVDRHKLLDFQHSQLYIKSSAKLHALSVAVNKQNPELIQSLVKETPEMTKNVEQMFKPMMMKSLMCLGAYLEDQPKYCKQLNTINKLIEEDKLWDIYQETDQTDFPIMALTQMDPWCANMMFKYDDHGKVVSVKLLDFQSPKLTSPIKEFISFIWVSVHPNVRESKLNDLCHLYCNCLNENLAQLGCPQRLTFKAMMEEITFLSPLIIMIISTMLPICVADVEVNLQGLCNEELTNKTIKESSIYKWYASSTFKEVCPMTLDQLTNQGVFGYLNKKIFILGKNKYQRQST